MINDFARYNQTFFFKDANQRLAGENNLAKIKLLGVFSVYLLEPLNATLCFIEVLFSII